MAGVDRVKIENQEFKMKSGVAAGYEVNDVVKRLHADLDAGMSAVDVRILHDTVGFNEFLIEEDEPIYMKLLDSVSHTNLNTMPLYEWLSWASLDCERQSCDSRNTEAQREITEQQSRRERERLR